MGPSSKTRILLLSPDPVLREALAGAGFLVELCDSGADLYEAVQERRPDAVLVAASSEARDVLEHLAMINRRHPQPIIMLHSSAEGGLAARAVRAGVSAYVADGLSAEVVRSLVEVSIAHFHHARVLKQELDRTRRTLGERKLVERAKASLMESQGLTEPEAYNSLRQFAMDHRLSLAQAASELLNGD